MHVLGIKKEIDRLGRIVIPKDLRIRYNFENEVELIATNEGVLIKNSEYVLVEKSALGDFSVPKLQK